MRHASRTASDTWSLCQVMLSVTFRLSQDGLDYSRNLVGMSLAYRFGGEEESFGLDAIDNIGTIGLAFHDCGVVESMKWFERCDRK